MSSTLSALAPLSSRYESVQLSSTGWLTVLDLLAELGQDPPAPPDVDPESPVSPVLAQRAGAALRRALIEGRVYSLPSTLRSVPGTELHVTDPDPDATSLRAILAGALQSLPSYVPETPFPVDQAQDPVVLTADDPTGDFRWLLSIADFFERSGGFYVY